MASSLIFLDYFIASLELSHAFNLVPMLTPCRKFVRFKFLHIFQLFTCLSFGLCTSPFICTNFMKSLMSYLRSKHFSLVIYPDVILCIENSFKKCRTNLEKTILLLRSLDFLINEQKSGINPLKRCKFIGFMIYFER